MRVLITGSNGQLGKEMVCQLSELENYELHLCDINELDISNVDEVRNYTEKIKPELIINCAAYTAVDKCEEEIDLAYRVNAIGPRNLGIAAEKLNAKLVHISTDYVFDGNGPIDGNGNQRAYIEFDKTGPQTVYGESKLQGEKFVKEFCSKYFIIRTAWLYGDGNNFVKTMIGLSEKYDELKVVDDQVGSPTSTVELAKGILSLIETDNYGVFHGTCEGQCSWYDFTKEIFRLKGIKTKVNPCTSKEYPRLAKRPAYSVLDNKMFRITNGYKFSDWKVAIEKYLEEN